MQLYAKSHIGQIMITNMNLCIVNIRHIKAILLFICLQEDQTRVSVQFSRSVMSDSATPWIAARQASLSITNSQSLLKPMSIESVMPSSRLILCCPLLLLPPIPPSIREFQLQRQSFQWTPRTYLLAVQGTLKSLLQHHSSKASILQCSGFFMVQLSHPYMTAIY